MGREFGGQLEMLMRFSGGYGTMLTANASMAGKLLSTSSDISFFTRARHSTKSMIATCHPWCELFRHGPVIVYGRMIDDGIVLVALSLAMKKGFNKQLPTIYKPKL
ncbi:hypothetical protein TIFTF001_000993 [Ficus carica]|uniref:Uncharacterized protein n=1 Tax=Ficus carica TaxID=3494 RepID=A0AA87Z549_FICCA|nr:hypothetical protein TIFTF001_000993 [Ficus carica]